MLINSNNEKWLRYKKAMITFEKIVSTLISHIIHIWSMKSNFTWGWFHIWKHARNLKTIHLDNGPMEFQGSWISVENCVMFLIGTNTMHHPGCNNLSQTVVSLFAHLWYLYLWENKLAYSRRCVIATTKSFGLEGKDVFVEFSTW